MSVWSDMGLSGGRMNGVDPCTFLNAAYGFFAEVRKHIRPDTESEQLRDFDFSLRRKAGEHELNTRSDWELLGKSLSFPVENKVLGRPIPEIYWNTVPDRSGIFTQTEETLLGGETVPCPYAAPLMRREIMDPAWPLQRYGLIQKMRYMTVPLNIRSKVRDSGTGAVFWVDHYSESWQYGYLDTENFYWNGRLNTGRYILLEAEIPEYWRWGNTVCKIAFEGDRAEHYNGCPPPPVVGRGWHDGGRYLAGDYAGEYPFSGVVRLFGAADLSTHPDFARYFDPIE